MKKEKQLTISILLLNGYLTTSNSNQLKITNSTNQTNPPRRKTASTTHLLMFKII